MLSTSKVKEINIPFDYQPRTYQLEFLKAPQRFKIAVFHRRAGKSKTALNDQVCKALTTKGIYYYLLPTYKQAKTVCWDSLVKQHIPSEVYIKRNDSELAIYYKNGSIQRFAGCEDIDKHRGINPIDVVFDEYSEMSEEMWTTIIQPILRENKGTASFIFTPKGKNHSWKLVEMAKDNPEEWYVNIKSVKDTNVFSDLELQEIQRNTPQAMYDQEYMVSFLENASSVFRRVEEAVHHEEVKPEAGRQYLMGVDLAKYNDYTVITIIDLHTFRVAKQERFNQIDYNLQKSKIEAEYFKWNKPQIYLDSTGVGEPIHDDLSAKGLPIFAVRFNEQIRKDLLINLQIKLEQGIIYIPDDEILKTELKSFQYSLGESGRTKILVPSGLHDDMVFSLALAIYQLPQKPLPIPQSYRISLNRWGQENNANTSFE